MDEGDYIESTLGDITVRKDFFERKRSDSDRWRHIKTEYNSDEIIDKLHFSKIESVDFQPEAIYKPVVVNLEDGYGKVFFKDKERAENFYNRLRYRINVWKQNYQ